VLVTDCRTTSPGNDRSDKRSSGVGVDGTPHLDGPPGEVHLYKYLLRQVLGEVMVCYQQVGESDQCR
jgi:hypothetical protein